MEVGSEKDYAIVCGVVGHTESHCDGVCSELVHGDFPETLVGNCVLLHCRDPIPVYPKSRTSPLGSTKKNH